MCGVFFSLLLLSCLCFCLCFVLFCFCFVSPSSLPLFPFSLFTCSFTNKPISNMLLIRDYFQQQQIQGSYMDLSDTTGTATTTATSHRSSSSMSAYPGQGQQNQQQQPADLPPHLSSFQGSVETDTSGLFNNAGSAPSQQQQQTANMSDFVVWPSSSQPSITSASPSFASHQQAEPRWHNLHQYSAVSAAEPMFDEPRFSSSSAFDNMSDGGMSSTNMPSSPINPFDATSHPSVLCDGLPSPTRSSFGRSVGGVSLQLQQQGQFPSVMLNGGQLASGGVSFDGSGSNFSHTHHPSSSPSSGTIGGGGGGGGGGGDILFRGPISNRTVFDYPSSASGPTHFDQDMKAEGPLSVSPGSLWLNNSHQQHQHHKTPTPHPSPDSSPLGDHSFFHQNNQMPLPIDFGVSNNAQFGNSHINTSQLHPHYVQQQQQKQQSRAQTQRKSLPHSPPHRMGGGGGRPPSPRYNPAVMATREMLPSHPNSPSMSMHWGHRQNQPHGLPHHHQLMMKPNTIPSHANHPQQGHLASMSHPRRSHQQPFHHTQNHGAHPYHPSSGPSSSSTKRRAQGGLPVTATDHLKRQRAEQDALLVRLRKQGKSYKQIAQIGRFTEAESTLRGRYRTLTKSREERVRKPEWTDKDVSIYSPFSRCWW
ncbi:hypothetical protein SMAC4_09386 [Sordaria macrospora]|uniref:uncharacterized protein n=1 Tax=Sordaria macrospora TaxID=5147 RepID=UPI002B28EC42|nr:hypothetical protein SMAC4_09386 [Sordaria macrospora]